ncbi:MAG: CPBP family intramembrane glutamic endopeptidase [bacterium]
MKNLSRLLAIVLLEVLFVQWTPKLISWLRTIGLPLWYGEVGLFAVYGAALLLTAALFFAWALRTPIRQYGVRLMRRSDWEVALLGFGLLFPIAFIGRIADPSFDAVYAGAVGLFTPAHVGVFLLVLPFAIFREELFLRFSQKNLTEVIGVRWAIVALSASFCLLHYPGGFSAHAVSVLPSVFLGSIVLGLVFWKTQSFWAAFVVHLFYDATIVLQIFFHAARHPLAEGIFWILYGLVFLGTVTQSLRIIRSVCANRETVTVQPIVAVCVWIVALALPLLQVFLW